MSYLTRSLTLILLLGAPSANAEVLEGLWDITLAMKVDGVPRPFGPFSQTQCFTQVDIQDPNKLFGESVDSACQFTHKRYQANSYTFNLICNDNLAISGTGEVEYKKDQFTGHMEVNAQKRGGPVVESESYVIGKRIGPCQKQ